MEQQEVTVAVEVGVPGGGITATGNDQMSIRLAATPQSVDKEMRRVKCALYTGANILRMDYWTGEQYDLTLSLEADAIRLGRLNSGAAPVCDSHQTYEMENQVGVVNRAWVEGGKLYAEMEFSKGERVKDLWQDIEDGIVRNVSLGAWIHQKRDVTEKDSARKQMLAIDWEPYEISVIPVPADSGAVFLSAQQPAETVITNSGADAPNKEKSKMENIIETATAGAGAREADAVNLEAVRSAERNRIAEIQKLGATFKVDVSGFVANSTTVDGARAAILETLAARAEAQPATVSHVAVTRDAGDTMRENMTAQILLRSDPGRYKGLSDKAHDYVGLSLLDLAKECLLAKGETVRGKNRDQIALAALTTSDLPNIVADVANKTLRAGYENYPVTFREFCRQASAADFKNINRVQLSGAPALLKVNENGEIESGSMTDSKETYALATYARIVPVSRKTIVNDDMDALTRIPQAFGRKGAILESDIVWAIITANGNLADNVALFATAATRLNLAGSAAAMSVDTVGAGMAAMAKQKGPEGDTLNLMPEFLMVPVGKRVIAEQLMAPGQIAVAVTGVVPASIQKLKVIAEPRLDANSTTAWYLSASPSVSVVDTIEYSYLEGQEGMYIETQVGFDVDGIKIKARHDFGAKAIDFRGLYKNAGG